MRAQSQPLQIKCDDYMFFNFSIMDGWTYGWTDKAYDNRESAFPPVCLSICEKIELVTVTAMTVRAASATLFSVFMDQLNFSEPGLSLKFYKLQAEMFLSYPYCFSMIFF